MPARDPELQSFQYRIDLIAFVKETGYQVRAREGGEGLTVLEHANRDRIVVAQSDEGAWLYASANRYEWRASDETPAEAVRRLRDCIARTKDKGTIVEFVQARDCTARTQTVSVDCVRDRLRQYERERVPLDFHGALCPPTDLPERTPRIANALDPPKDWGTKPPERSARQGDNGAPPRVVVITASPAHAALYYEQCGKHLGHTKATAVYTSVGAEKPRQAGWDLQAVDKLIAAMPARGAVLAALPGSPANDRLAGELRALAARYPHVTFERQTLRVDRDRSVREPDRQAFVPARSFHAVAPGRGR